MGKRINRHGMAAMPSLAPQVTSLPGSYPAGWAPLPHVGVPAQIGKFAGPTLTPMGINWAGVQMKCGVEGLRKNWMVYTGNGSDTPYFQQTVIGQRPRGMLSLGGRPGANLGPAQVSLLLGPQRRTQAAQAQAVADGFLGW